MGGCKSLDRLESLMCTSAIWGHYPVWSHLEFPQGSQWRVAAVWWLLDGRYSFLPEFPQGSPAGHPYWLQKTVTSFVYWYGRKDSIFQYKMRGIRGECSTVPVELQEIQKCWIPPPFLFLLSSGITTFFVPKSPRPMYSLFIIPGEQLIHPLIHEHYIFFHSFITSVLVMQNSSRS